jgi:hypothetical protein
MDVLVSSGIGVLVEGTLQFGALIALVSSDTAPFCARSLPVTSAPVVSVIDAKARMLPLKSEFVPSVAELPTCQKTLQAWAPLMKLTLLPGAVVKVLAILKMKTASGSFWPSNVSAPVRPKEPEAES